MAEVANADNELSKKEKSPPRPPLVLHVGVLGHRPDPGKRPMPDVEALKKVIRDILRQIQDAVTGIATASSALFSVDPREGQCQGIVRVISTLAEGADQWVADEAINLGYELQAPIPFSEEEYAKDFHGPALNKFHTLKNNADRLLELDGSRNRESESYEAAGRLVISQSDLVIAIWDGCNEKGRGGTGQMVRESLGNGVPVIWVKWVAPEHWQLLDTSQWRVLANADELKGEFSRLASLINTILLPPDREGALKKPDRANSRNRYYNETERRWNVNGRIWRLLRKLILFKTPKENETERERKGIQEKSNKDKRFVGWTDKSYITHYAWSNKFAVFYGDLHRSYTVLNCTLSALAVLFALLGIPALVYGHRDTVAILLELASIGLIIFLTLRGKIGGWHERWIQYRILAEHLRIVVPFLDLLGGIRQNYSLPGHLGTYGNPANTWVYWHYRAVSRSVGLPRIKFNNEYLASIHETLRELLISDQIEYHKENARNLSTIDRHLHWLSNSMFIATFTACSIHLCLVIAMNDVPDWTTILLITLNALLPTFGAAIAAIRNQGEFSRIAQRSIAMYEELYALRLSFSQIAPRGEELKSLEMRQVIERISRLMVNETLDWRIIFQDRPLVLPT